MKVTDSVHDAQLTTARLMMGLPVEMRTGVNHIEEVETLLKDMAMVLQRVQQTGGVGSPQDVVGLQNMAGYIGQHLQIIAQDKGEKQRVKKYGDALGKLMNLVKAMAQRQQEAAQKQQGAQGGGMDPKDTAKIQATMMTAKAKAQLAKESHAQKTAQRAITFEQQTRQQAEQHRADLAAKDLTAVAEVRRSNIRSMKEHEG